MHVVWMYVFVCESHLKHYIWIPTFKMLLYFGKKRGEQKCPLLHFSFQWPIDVCLLVFMPLHFMHILWEWKCMMPVCVSIGNWYSYCSCLAGTRVKKCPCLVFVHCKVCVHALVFDKVDVCRHIMRLCVGNTPVCANPILNTSLLRTDIQNFSTIGKRSTRWQKTSLHKIFSTFPSNWELWQRTLVPNEVVDVDWFFLFF